MNPSVNRYLVHFAHETLHPQIRAWERDTEVRDALSREIDALLSLVDDLVYADGFSQAAPVVGAAVEDYRIRVLEIGPGDVMLAGIRFRPSPAFSFVELYARSVTINNQERLRTVARELRKTFTVFNPAFLRLSVAVDSAEDRIIADHGGIVDFVTVAGLTSSIQCRTPPPNMERLRLSSVHSSEYLTPYQIEYAAFHAGSEELRDLVPEASVETLEKCRAQGLLCAAWLDGQWAGLIAGRKQTAFGLTGVRIVEELLAAPFRGQGLGPALQRQFVESISAEEYPFVHGAIHPANTPSHRTAQAVGRVDVMRTWLVPLSTGG